MVNIFIGGRVVELRKMSQVVELGKYFYRRKSGRTMEDVRSS